MIIKSRLIHHHDETTFDIPADAELYWQIANDMLQNAGKFAPRSVWQKLDNSDERFCEIQFTQEQMKENAVDLINKYPTLQAMFFPWLGATGKKEELEEERLKSFRSFLDILGDTSFFDTLRNSNSYQIITDYRTVEEITAIAVFTKEKDHLKVLEVGGGYGRLAEGLLNVYSGQIHYVLADSVPISLMYCFLYLKKQFPSLKVGIYYNDPDANPSDYDCYIVPTWRMENVFDRFGILFDMCVNIQSMQEMSQWHIDRYMDVFQKYSKIDAFVYLNNNKKYIFRGDWNYPGQWRLLYRHNSPWSWSVDCPTEVFQKGCGEYEALNRYVSCAHI